MKVLSTVRFCLQYDVVIRAGLELENTVGKRSYSRAIFRSFHLAQSHSFTWRKPLTFWRKVCEIRVSIEGSELAPNQIPPSALMPALLGCGFGCGSVAVLVTIRDTSQSQMTQW